MNKPNNMRRRASRDRIETAFVRLLQDRELSSLSRYGDMQSSRCKQDYVLRKLY